MTARRAAWRPQLSLLLIVFANFVMCEPVDGQAVRVRPTATEMRRQLDLARVSKTTAQALQKSGEYGRAASEYSKVIETFSGLADDSEMKAVLADAFFGRASAVQLQRRPDAIDGPVTGAELTPLDSTAVRDYERASALDSSRFFSAANNNAGMLLHDLGRHREALARFQAATRSPHPARGAFFAHVGDEFMELKQPDDAARAYRSALADDSTLAGARAGLLRAFTARSSADSLLRVASKWSSNEVHATQIVDAMYAALIDGRWRRGGLSSGAIADSCLELLALNFAALGLGPADVARSHAGRLAKVAASEPGTKGGVDALLAAYVNVAGVARHSSDGDFTGPEWWGRTEGRRDVWSTVLGGIGRWHDARGADSTAMRYYEAALGMPWRYNEPPTWIDIEIIFPLAVLYSSDAAQRAAPPRLNAFLDGVFQSKLVAYQERNVPRIRRFHTALGAVFASRGEWKGEPRGAVFQLERMRVATRQLNQLSGGVVEAVHDAPELLQQLVKGYCAIGEVEKAKALARQIVGEAQRAGLAVEVAHSCASVGAGPRSRG